MTNYNVKCVNGHSFQVAKGSVLEQKCIKHCKESSSGILVIHSSGCPECRIEELCYFSEGAAWEYEFEE